MEQDTCSNNHRVTMSKVWRKVLGMVWFVASASQQFPTIAAFSTKSTTNTNTKKHRPQQTNTVLDPIAKLMTDTVTAVLAQLEQHNHETTGGGDGTERRRRLTIHIENEISGNTFHETNSKGFIFAPVLTVDNDMHGSMHNNNNAHSDSGSGKYTHKNELVCTHYVSHPIGTSYSMWSILMGGVDGWCVKSSHEDQYCS